jgi:hypothetical protein
MHTTRRLIALLAGSCLIIGMGVAQIVLPQLEMECSPLR